MNHFSAYITKGFLAAAVVILVGCSDCTSKDSVVINYEQIGSCNGYQDGNNTIAAGPNAAFVVFRIIDIDNSKTKKDFIFDPDHLFVNASPDAHMDKNLSLAQLIGALRAVQTTIPKGKKVGINGFVVTTVQTVNVNGAIEANQTNYLLSIDPVVGTSVLLSKKNPTQTEWPLRENCLEIKY